MNKKGAIITFVDLITLLYHEGRNVRHLVEDGKLSDDKRFLSLRDGLARNRDDAWNQIQPLRLKAKKAGSGGEVERLFKQRFKLTLDDLIVLYAHHSWKGTPYGGNAWLPIAQRVKKVSDLLNCGSEDEANCEMSQILEMSHNTGKVIEKLKKLDNY